MRLWLLAISAVCALLAFGCRAEADSESGQPPSVASSDSISVQQLRAAALSALDQRKGDTLAVEADDHSLRVFAGHLFSPDRRHLYVQLVDRYSEVAVAVFGLGGWDVSPEPLLVERMSQLNYMADTLRDANGDGSRDYVSRFYPSSGCCRRNIDVIRLYNPDSGEFAKAFELINPTYYPAEGVVRGVEYGQSGEVPLYKARFMGLYEPERVECVYPQDRTPGLFIRGACSQGLDPEGELLHELPEEYRDVEELSWFLAY